MVKVGDFKVTGYIPESGEYTVKYFGENKRWGKTVKLKIGYSELKSQITKAYQAEQATIKALKTIKKISKKSKLVSIFNSIEHSGKAQTLLENIGFVLASKIDQSNYPGLADAMMSKLDSMSDEQIESFSEAHKFAIQLYFTYKPGVESSAEIDGRIAILAQALGIDIYDYEMKPNVPNAQAKSDARDIAIARRVQFLDLKQEKIDNF